MGIQVRILKKPFQTKGATETVGLWNYSIFFILFFKN